MELEVWWETDTGTVVTMCQCPVWGCLRSAMAFLALGHDQAGALRGIHHQVLMVLLRASRVPHDEGLEGMQCLTHRHFCSAPLFTEKTIPLVACLTPYWSLI